MTTPNEELLARAKRLRHELGDSNARLDRQCATAMYEMEQALQSQAERIKELESEVEMWKATANAVVDFEKVQLRAEIAAIAATEPSMIYHGRCVIDCGDSGHQDVTMLKMIARETKLFTHPMPAQRLTELKLLMLTTAYEQGVGKGIQRRDCNPYAADTDEHAAWKLGYEEGLGLRRI